MKAIHSQLQSMVCTAVSSLGAVEPTCLIEVPTDPTHGDYTTNCALTLFRELSNLSTESQWKKPHELAQTISEQIEKIKPSWLESVAIAGPGFINFCLSKDFLAANLGFYLNIGDNGESLLNRDQNIVIEYTDPNPFKEFHIGHLYSNTVGEAISRLLEATGATVWRADYFGDVGMHVAKSIWGMQQKMRDESLTLEQLGAWPLAKRINFLGQAYALGATAYEENESAKTEISQLNFLVYKAGQDRLVEQEAWEPVIDYSQFISPESEQTYPAVKELYFTGRAWSLEYFEEIYQRLGVHFDGYYPESKAGEWGTAIVREQLGKGVFQESQGAVIFAGGEHGLHDRVFLNSLGLPTYEAKELALPKLKMKDFAYDRSVIITGNEINEYFKVLLKALSLIEPEIAAQTTHIGHGMVRLPEGKMSSRTGKIVTGSRLLDQAKEEILKVATDSSLSQEEQEAMAELVGQAAIKYTFLKQSIGGDITFDFKESLDIQGNSGPYLLYTYVRARNVLRQAAEVSKNTIEQLIDIVKGYTVSNTKVYTSIEIDIQRKIEKYIYVVEQAALEYAPHQLCTYIYQLAQLYNSWYAQQRIVESENGALTDDSLRRLQLNQAVAQVLKRALDRLGIRTVEHM